VCVFYSCSSEHSYAENEKKLLTFKKSSVTINYNFNNNFIGDNSYTSINLDGIARLTCQTNMDTKSNSDFFAIFLLNINLENIRKALLVMRSNEYSQKLELWNELKMAIYNTSVLLDKNPTGKQFTKFAELSVKMRDKKIKCHYFTQPKGTGKIHWDYHAKAIQLFDKYLDESSKLSKDYLHSQRTREKESSLSQEFKPKDI